MPCCCREGEDRYREVGSLDVVVTSGDIIPKRVQGVINVISFILVISPIPYFQGLKSAIFHGFEVQRQLVYQQFRGG